MGPEAKAGDRVTYRGHDSVSDEQIKRGSNDDPREYLTEGEVFTLSDVEVHSWHTQFYIKGVPGARFNSVHFEPAD